MDSKHLTDAEIVAVRDGHSVPPRAAKHLRSCARCRAALARSRLVAVLLSSVGWRHHRRLDDARPLLFALVASPPMEDEHLDQETMRQILEHPRLSGDQAALLEHLAHCDRCAGAAWLALLPAGPVDQAEVHGELLAFDPVREADVGPELFEAPWAAPQGVANIAFSLREDLTEVPPEPPSEAVAYAIRSVAPPRPVALGRFAVREGTHQEMLFHRLTSSRSLRRKTGKPYRETPVSSAPKKQQPSGLLEVNAGPFVLRLSGSWQGDLASLEVSARSPEIGEPVHGLNIAVFVNEEAPRLVATDTEGRAICSDLPTGEVELLIKHHRGYALSLLLTRRDAHP